MTIKPYHYARALFDETRTKTGKDAEKTVVAFGALLARRGHRFMLQSIAKEYQSLLVKHNTLASVTIQSAEPVSDAIKNMALAFLDMPAETPVKEILRQELIGGLIISTPTTRYDASLRGALGALKDHCVRA